MSPEPPAPVARLVRRVVVAICGAGVAGMIVSSIADNTSAALTFGLLTAGAVACLMVATAVSGAAGDREALAAGLEEQVQELVAAGASEEAVRQLVHDSMRLAREEPHRRPSERKPGA